MLPDQLQVTLLFYAALSSVSGWADRKIGLSIRGQTVHGVCHRIARSASEKRHITGAGQTPLNFAPRRLGEHTSNDDL